MLKNLTLTEFVAETASTSPAPGGGSISALCGALGAALVTMVAGLTPGNNASISQEITGNISKELVNAVDEDTAAFNQVMKALKMPKTTPEEKQARKQALIAATWQAARVPLSVADNARQVMDLAVTALRQGNPNCLSDAGVAFLVADTALRGAVFNVVINAPSLPEGEEKQKLLNAARQLEQQADQLRAQVYPEIKLRLGETK